MPLQSPGDVVTWPVITSSALPNPHQLLSTQGVLHTPLGPPMRGKNNTHFHTYLVHPGYPHAHHPPASRQYLMCKWLLAILLRSQGVQVGFPDTPAWMQSIPLHTWSNAMLFDITSCNTYSRSVAGARTPGFGSISSTTQCFAASSADAGCSARLKLNIGD